MKIEVGSPDPKWLKIPKACKEAGITWQDVVNLNDALKQYEIKIQCSPPYNDWLALRVVSLVPGSCQIQSCRMGAGQLLEWFDSPEEMAENFISKFNK